MKAWEQVVAGLPDLTIPSSKHLPILVAEPPALCFFGSTQMVDIAPGRALPDLCLWKSMCRVMMGRILPHRS